MGGHSCDDATTRQAHALGAAIAARGWTLLTGGRNEGVMAAATEGANAMGGLTLGIHPGFPGDPDVASADIVVHTGMHFARNMVNVLSSHVVVALPGDTGTLNEVAYAVTYERPTILFGFDDRGWFAERVMRASTLEEVLEMIANVVK